MAKGCQSITRRAHKLSKEWICRVSLHSLFHKVHHNEDSTASYFPCAGEAYSDSSWPGWAGWDGQLKSGAYPTSTHPAVQRYKITTLECNNIIVQLALQFPMVNQHLQSEHHCKGVTYGFSKGKGFRLHFEIFVAKLKSFSLKHFPF